MNAVKRQRPNISPDDLERLLFHLEDARVYIVKYGAAQGFHSPERATSDHAMQAIDSLAGQITGNPQYFWMGRASAGGNQMAYVRGMEKEAKRRRLMGVWAYAFRLGASAATRMSCSVSNVKAGAAGRTGR